MRSRRNVIIVLLLFFGFGAAFLSNRSEAKFSTELQDAPDSLAFRGDEDEPLTSSSSTSVEEEEGVTTEDSASSTVDGTETTSGSEGKTSTVSDLSSSVDATGADGETTNSVVSETTERNQQASVLSNFVSSSSTLFFFSSQNTSVVQTLDTTQLNTTVPSSLPLSSSTNGTSSSGAGTTGSGATSGQSSSSNGSSSSSNSSSSSSQGSTSSQNSTTSTSSQSSTSSTQGSTTSTTNQQPIPDSYAENLAMIRTHSGRNTLHDGSAYRNTPQSLLDISNSSALLGSRSEYLGSPNGNPERAFPVANGGQFRTSCEFSHFAYDDPLLYPGQPGKAHLHMFFGNTDVNAFSTFNTLKDTGSSTCNGQELNRTGYWAPAMLDGDGFVRVPERVVVYYKGEGMANGAIRPEGGGSQVYQPGMANIAPHPSVAQVPNSDGGAVGQVNYKCSNNFSGYPPVSSVVEIPTCDGDYWDDTYGAPYPATRMVLEMEIKFWNCFPTGASTSSWQSWQPAGATRGGWFYSNCNGAGGGNPANADIYPNLTYYVNYVVEPGEDTSDWFLSSDISASSVTGTPQLAGLAGSEHHADWWGGWHPDINEEWIDNCVNFASAPDASGSRPASGCGFGYLSNGGPDGNNPLAGRALQYRPQYDTVGDASTYKISSAQLFSEICTPLNPSHSYTTPGSEAYCTP